MRSAFRSFRAPTCTCSGGCLALLADGGLGHVIVFGGGIIPDVDRNALVAEGVGEIFTPGASLDTISSWLLSRVEQGSGRN